MTAGHFTKKCEKFSIAETYIVDLVIFSNSWDELLKHVDAVLDILEKANLTVNLNKM